MSRTFTYDAENRQVSATINSNAASYAYDGNGLRVGRTVNGTATTYVYDAFGELAAEYTPGTATSSCDTSTCYAFLDHLGSTRMLTDANGSTNVTRYDYLPFGGELLASTNGRTTAMGYFGSPDSSNPKFTSKERDAETGLDWFNSRYDSSAQGRFTSPDPHGANMLRVVNPQRWNMYAYAVNNPLTFIDPDGKDAIAVNFPSEIPMGGHEGIIVVGSDGSATYARFGPQGGAALSGPGEVTTQALTPVQFQSNGLPTDASYKQMAKEVAAVEGQPASAPGFNYFKTSEADTLSLQQWITQMKALSDAGKAPSYAFNTQNCATFCIAGLLRAHAIENKNISIIPNRLFMLLMSRATENWTWQGRSNPEPDAKKRVGPTCLKDRDGNCAK